MNTQKIHTISIPGSRTIWIAIISILIALGIAGLTHGQAACGTRGAALEQPCPHHMHCPLPDYRLGLVPEPSHAGMVTSPVPTLPCTQVPCGGPSCAHEVVCERVSHYGTYVLPNPCPVMTPPHLPYA